jgi:hypothetical protein
VEDGVSGLSLLTPAIPLTVFGTLFRLGLGFYPAWWIMDFTRPIKRLPSNGMRSEGGNANGDGKALPGWIDFCGSEIGSSLELEPKPMLYAERRRRCFS